MKDPFREKDRSWSDPEHNAAGSLVLIWTGGWTQTDLGNNSISATGDGWPLDRQGLYPSVLSCHVCRDCPLSVLDGRFWLKPTFLWSAAPWQQLMGPAVIQQGGPIVSPCESSDWYCYIICTSLVKETRDHRFQHDDLSIMITQGFTVLTLLLHLLVR